MAIHSNNPTKRKNMIDKNSTEYMESNLQNQTLEDSNRVFSGNVSLQQGLMNCWEKGKDEYLMMATIRHDTWNVLNMQHITSNQKKNIQTPLFVVLEI